MVGHGCSLECSCDGVAQWCVGGVGRGQRTRLRNAAVRGCCGCGQDLVRRSLLERRGPSSRNTTVSATSRAKPISWVTMIIVVPAAARSLITASTSPTSSGSSAEVGSSKRTSRGRSARARAIATRCCWPPRELARVGVDLVGQADPLEQRPGLDADLRLVPPEGGDGRLDHVVQHGQVREQVEALEDEADPGPLAQDRALAQLVQPAADGPDADQLAVDADEAGVQLLQVVDRAQQRRLARPGRAEDDGDLALLDVEVDARAAPGGCRRTSSPPGPGPRASPPRPRPGPRPRVPRSSGDPPPGPDGREDALGAGPRGPAGRRPARSAAPRSTGRPTGSWSGRRTRPWRP